MKRRAMLKAVACAVVGIPLGGKLLKETQPSNVEESELEEPVGMTYKIVGYKYKTAEGEWIAYELPRRNGKNYFYDTKEQL